MSRPDIRSMVIPLDETEKRFLETKKENTRLAYYSALKRFRLYYPDGISGLIKNIEAETLSNQSKEIHERIRPGENILKGFIDWHEGYGYANKTTIQALAAIQNALKYYGLTISYNFIVLPPNQSLKQNSKHEWKLDHLAEFVQVARHPRDKAFIMFAFQSGLSISDILSLNYCDIKNDYENSILPLSITGYREKTNEPIRTFIGKDAHQYLKQYLDTRPNIRHKDPVFTMIGSNVRASPDSIRKLLRGYSKDVSFTDVVFNAYSPTRPHSLRSGFRSRLTGKMDGDLIEFFMSHSGTKAKTTYMNMPTDELREIYAKFEHELSIHDTSIMYYYELQNPDKIPAEVKGEMEDMQRMIMNQTMKNAQLENQMMDMKRDQEELLRLLQTLTKTQ